MDIVISQIVTLSTQNESDLKKLRDFLRHEQESLKANAAQIEQALPTLDLVQNTLGIAFLLAAQLSAGAVANPTATRTYIGKFLKAADEQQVKKAMVPMNSVCKTYAQMAIDEGQQAMVLSIGPLRCAVEKLRPHPETLTPIHAELLRVCLKAKAYHLAVPVLEQPIYDIAVSSLNQHMTPQSFLSYFYYGALVRIGLKQYAGALQLLMVVLTCPASCLSAIQADSYKKYVLLSLKVNGEVANLPSYCSHIVQRFAKSPSYVNEIAEAFKRDDLEAVERLAEEKAQAIQADQNMGLVKQVLASRQRRKVQTLTKTYLTLSLAEIAKEVGWDVSRVTEVEDLLFDMISCGEINARIDSVSGNVSFEDDCTDAWGNAMVVKLQEKMDQILGLAQRIAAFEEEVVQSDAYIRRTMAMEDHPGGGAPSLGGGYDSMDM
mmetsp:Transcript_10303/g.23229  ORF Transcript_10303/g.23229 Transcript_10303/m.23229 type:complete len:434 (+) Transcript_10303:44-1345(+)